MAARHPSFSETFPPPALQLAAKVCSFVTMSSLAGTGAAQVDVRARTGQGMAGRGRAGQSRAGRAGQGRAGQPGGSGPAPYSPLFRPCFSIRVPLMTVVPLSGFRVSFVATHPSSLRRPPLQSLFCLTYGTVHTLAVLSRRLSHFVAGIRVCSEGSSPLPGG